MIYEDWDDENNVYFPGMYIYTEQGLSISPIELAIRLDRVTIMETLLSSYPGYAQQNHYGEIPIFLACHYNSPQCFATLLEHADIVPMLHMKDVEGTLPIHMAVQKNIEMVRAILDKEGITDNIHDKYPRDSQILTAALVDVYQLDSPVIGQALEIIQLLISAGTEYVYTDQLGCPLLQHFREIVSTKGHYECIMYNLYYRPGFEISSTEVRSMIRRHYEWCINISELLLKHMDMKNLSERPVRNCPIRCLLDGMGSAIVCEMKLVKHEKEVLEILEHHHHLVKDLILLCCKHELKLPCGTDNSCSPAHHLITVTENVLIAGNGTESVIVCVHSPLVRTTMLEILSILILYESKDSTFKIDGQNLV